MDFHGDFATIFFWTEFNGQRTTSDSVTQQSVVGSRKSLLQLRELTAERPQRQQQQQQQQQLKIISTVLAAWYRISLTTLYTDPSTLNLHLFTRIQYSLPMEDYDPIRLLGEGSFGKVYLMRDKKLRKFVCVKIIKIKNIPKKEREATKNEVDLLKKLNHPNIVRYIDSFLSKNKESLCISMEYCDGGDLATQIKNAKRNLFNESKILHWFVQIALGLHYMHTNRVLHRDLKTQNIFLLGNGRLVLGDLGISKVLEGTMDFAQTCIGTPYYMSPEIFQNKPYSYKSDVWALGCVLYEMTTLNHAFDEKSLNGLAQKIIKGRYPSIHAKYSRNLADLIAQMLSTNPMQRPDMDQILRKPFIKKHIINFFVDISSRPSNSIGEGTMIVRGAVGGPVSGALNQDSNMIAFQQQLQALNLTAAIAEAMAPQEPPTDPMEAKKLVREQVGALRREEEHKSMVEAALEKLRLEREARLRERQAAMSKAAAPSDSLASKARERPRPAGRVPAVAAAKAREGAGVAAVLGNPRVNYSVEQQRIDRERRAAEERRRQQEVEQRERAEEKRREDARAELRAREEARLQRQRDEAEAKAKAARREQAAERERERQRAEIEQLRRDKLELDRRTQEKERQRQARAAEESKRIEDARRADLLEKEHLIDPRLRAEEKDDTLRPRERGYKQTKASNGMGYEFDRARAPGRVAALELDEIGSRLKQATEGVGSRFESGSPKSGAVRGARESSSGSEVSDEEESVNDAWDRMAEDNIEDEEEDMKVREEELKAELNVATKRVEELKHTVKATKSFIQIASSQNLLQNPKSFVNGTVVSTIESEINSDDSDEEDDDDAYIVDETAEFEVSCAAHQRSSM